MHYLRADWKRLRGFVRRPGRGTLMLAGGLIVFFAAYGWFLDYQENRVKTYFSDLRNSDPELYLNEVSKVVGFERYLEQYRAIKGYDIYRGDVPSFLLGRWALFDQPKRVSDAYFADTCVDSIAFEDGLIKISNGRIRRRAASYELNNDTVLVKLDNKSVMKVKLVSYGVRLHHIELTPPGAHRLRYGYLCK